VNLSNSELDTDSLELNLTNVITMGESSAFLQVQHSLPSGTTQPSFRYNTAFLQVQHSLPSGTVQPWSFPDTGYPQPSIRRGIQYE
jgi:hypothetical protein